MLVIYQEQLCLRVTNISYEHAVSVFRVQQSKKTAGIWKRQLHVPLTCQYQVTSWNGIIYQKMYIFVNTAVKTQNLAKL